MDRSKQIDLVSLQYPTPPPPVGGRLLIYESDKGWAPGVYMQLDVHGLLERTPGRFYTLYITSPTLGRRRFSSFNTSGPGLPAPAFRLDEWNVPADYLTETITVEVINEEDDGTAGMGVHDFTALTGNG